MTIEIPGIDADAGLDLYDGDMDIYLRVLRAYVPAVSKALDKIRNVSAETLKDYAVSVHGIKSTSNSIGAEETRMAAKELELMAKAGDIDGVLAKNEAFIKKASVLVNNIKSWLEKNDSAAS